MATPSSAIQLDGWDFARVSVTRSWTYGFLSDGNDARGWTPRNLRGEACDGAGHPIICAGGAARDSIARPTPEFPRKKNGPQVPIRDICWDLGQWRMASRRRAPQDKDEPNASRISANKRAAPFVPDCPLAFEQRRPIMGLESVNYQCPACGGPLRYDGGKGASRLRPLRLGVPRRANRGALRAEAGEGGVQSRRCGRRGTARCRRRIRPRRHLRLLVLRSRARRGRDHGCLRVPPTAATPSSARRSSPAASRPTS